MIVMDKIVNHELESYYGKLHHWQREMLVRKPGGQISLLTKAIRLALEIQSAFPTKVYLSSLYGSIPDSNEHWFFTELL